MTNPNFDPLSSKVALFHRTAIIAIAVSIMTIALTVVLWPVVARQQLQNHVQAIFAQESVPLLKPLSGLAGESSPKAQCMDRQHSYWRTMALCQAFRIYPYNPTPVPAERRQDIAVHAKELDRLLKSRGWTLDRPNDSVTTIVGSLPSTPLQTGYSTQSVPLHKNIDGVSCNLKISFTGPTDGQSPGIVMVDEFSCQQNSSYFQFHPGGPWASPGI
jgi:hypothetical protein